MQATLENAKLTTNRRRPFSAVPPANNPPMTQRSPTSVAWKRKYRPRSTSAAIADQSRLHRDPFADRRQDRPYRGNRWQRRQREFGVLTTIVSQDPMYVTFPVSVRESLGLRERYATRGGFKAVIIKVRLPDGRVYNQTGQLNFVNNTIAQNTDTISLRGTIPNPTLHDPTTTDGALRELTDGEFVTVSLQGVERSRYWPFRARPCCRISRANMSMSSAPTTRLSSTGSSSASRHRRSPR